MSRRTEVVLGRYKHQFSQRWYRSRFEILKKDGLIKDFSRMPVYAKWRSVLKEYRKTKTIKEIAELANLGLTAIQKDLKYLDLQDCNISDKVYKRGTIMFLDDPYKCASEMFSYDPKTGVVICLKVSNIDVVDNVGKEVTKTVCVRGRNLSLKQLSWLLYHKEMPSGKVFSRVNGSNKIEDLYIMQRGSDNIDKAAHREKIVVFGREKWVDVDSSRDTPQSMAQKKRARGECTGCGNYSWCLDRDFKKRCPGKIAKLTENDKMRQRALEAMGK